MMQFVRRIRFHMSINNDILVLDAPPFDMFPNEIPKDALKGTVSQCLAIPYLSKYEKSIEELDKTTKYQGSTIGLLTRLFFSIPTAKQDSSGYYYVHYLLSPGSPYTTLTNQALCCIHGKSTNSLGHPFSTARCSIGGTIVDANVSTQNPSRDPSPHFHNANILGMNFLRKHKLYRHEADFRNHTAVLELIKR